MIPLFVTLAALIPICYQLASLAASLRFKLQRPRHNGSTPPVSILKPVRGLDEEFDQAILSHALQEYPEFEILFGVHTLDDPAVPYIRALIAAHPSVPIQLILSTHPAANGKVGVLIDLARHARHSVMVVNDSDVSVPADYLRRVTAPLVNDPSIGLVTCIYRAEASSLAGRFEAFGIATDFIPSTLVAPLVGVKEFGLGSTLCFRREDLDAIGGFEAIADFIADDYQLARRITAFGKRAHLSETVVETHLSDPTLNAVWSHQVRWARTIRVSRGDGYAGLPVTHTGLWAALLWAFGFPVHALACAAVRAAAALAAAIVLRDKRAMALFPFALVWDIWAFIVWIAGWSGHKVEWRGTQFTLTADGRLHPITSEPRRVEAG